MGTYKCTPSPQVFLDIEILNHFGALDSPYVVQFLNVDDVCILLNDKIVRDPLVDPLILAFLSVLLLLPRYYTPNRTHGSFLWVFLVYNILPLQCVFLCN